MSGSTKIQSEIDVNRVLDTLVVFGQAKIWTEQHLSELTRIPKPRVKDAVRALLDKGHITIYNDEWRITQDGLDHHSEVCYDSRLKLSRNKFVEEARTGARESRSENGYTTLTPTEIQSAAIPGTEKHYQSSSSPRKGRLRKVDESPEASAIRKNQLERAQIELSEIFGLSIDLVREYLASGKIRTCNGWGARLPHMGLFSRKGERWQHLCKDCTRQKKKARE